MTCRSCGRPIVWAKLDTGTRMPLDAHPVAVPVIGLVVFNAKTEGGHVIARGELLEAAGWVGAGATLHRSHFATCPHASSHRGVPAGQEALDLGAAT